MLISYGTHPTSRLCPAIHLANSSDISIQDVTIYEAGGMGVIAERTENIHLNRVTVTSTEDRLVSTRADATHFIGCKGMIRVENCLFEHMLDDAINVHGAYVKVVEYLGNNEFLCEISHFQQWGLIFAEPGDKLALLSRETVLPFFETTVTKTRVLNEHRVVVTVSDVPEQMPEGPLSMENLTWYPDRRDAEEHHSRKPRAQRPDHDQGQSADRGELLLLPDARHPDRRRQQLVV